MSLRDFMKQDPEIMKMLDERPTVEVPTDLFLLMNVCLSPKNLRSLTVGQLEAIQDQSQSIIDEVKASIQTDREKEK